MGQSVNLSFLVLGVIAILVRRAKWGRQGCTKRIALCAASQPLEERHRGLAVPMLT